MPGRLLSGGDGWGRRKNAGEHDGPVIAVAVPSNRRRWKKKSPDRSRGVAYLAAGKPPPLTGRTSLVASGDEWQEANTVHRYHPVVTPNSDVATIALPGSA